MIIGGTYMTNSTSKFVATSVNRSTGQSAPPAGGVLWPVERFTDVAANSFVLFGLDIEKYGKLGNMETSTP